MQKLIYILGIVSCLLLSVTTYANDRIKQIENQLSAMTAEMPGLEEKVQMSVSGVSIQEFMRGIADAHKLNISVDPAIQQEVVNNFANATVSDVLIFICKEYELSINFIGSIMSIVKYDAPKPVVVETPKKVIQINYDKSGDKLFLDLNDDSLETVAKLITQKSKKNMVLASGVTPKLVSSYIEDMPFDNAMEKFGIANDLSITKTEDGFYLIDKKIITNESNNNKTDNRNTNKSNKTTGRNSGNNIVEEFSFNAKSNLDISVFGSDVQIADVIKSVASETGTDYYFVSDIKDKTTVNVQSTSFQGLLENLLQGTEITYEYRDGIYIIGERKTEGLRMTKVIQLQHRSVEKVTENIPANIKQNVDVKEFVDLNSLILSGSHPQIKEIELFIKQIDKVVPVVLIEVMIVDYSNKRTNSTGIEVGLGDNPTTTTATILSDPSVNLSSNSINDLIESFNGYGILNLGK